MADGRVIQVPDWVLGDDEYLPSMSRECRLTEHDEEADES